jgi:DNA invertase Pin-like site-specific DNA recombinase
MKVVTDSSPLVSHAGEPRVAVLYARVSDADKQDTEQMLRSLERFVDGRRWPVGARCWDKITGDPGRRSGDPPGLATALAYVQRLGGRGVLVVTGVERLVRSPIALLQMIARVQALSGAVCSMEDGADCDTTSDVGELALFVKGWFARMYIKFIRAGTNRVLEDRKRLIQERGGFVSSRSGTWREKLGRPAVSPELVKRMRELYQEQRKMMRDGLSVGLKPEAAARLLGMKGSTVRTYFRRWQGQEGFNPYPMRHARNGGEERAEPSGETAPSSGPKE